MSGALVTGGASGIGLAVARMLVAQGHRVVIADVDGEAVQRATAELGEAGSGRIIDVRDRGACDGAAAAAARADGGLRMVAHCAGVVRGDAAVADLDAATWERILGINLGGTFNVVAAALPHLVDAGGGAIVLASSVAAIRGLTRLAAYSASKAGMIGLARSVVADYAMQGVRVNCVCPGGTDTPLTAGTSRRPPHNAHGRKATAEEVAATIAWLLSDASAWVNGAVLPVDDAESATYAGAFVRPSPPAP
jgi:NAD(P)-dependent dehydrogenase (short-subunit alcohol dehydrogenase family)